MTRIAAATSTLEETGAAAALAAAEAADQLAGAHADLVFLFLSPHHLDEASDAVTAVRDALRPRCLAGCVAEGVIGGERELESGPALSVWAASLPGALIAPFHVTAELEDGEVSLSPIPDLTGTTLVMLLVDPFTIPPVDLIEQLNVDYPGLPVVGGIAAGAGRPGAQALVLDDLLANEGAVGVAIGGVDVAAVVSQGCAPLGPEAVITRAEGNVVFELAGQPAYERLRSIIGGLSHEQRLQAAQGLLAGIVIDENKPAYERGDYLMRGIVGADEQTGALAINESVRIGQTLRFHARDASSADEDLQLALDGALSLARRPPAGALLFTCNGRGARMFGSPDHDSRAVAGALRTPALAGFFCGGEIGPVGGRSFLHGFTATMAIFLDASGPGGPAP